MLETNEKNKQKINKPATPFWQESSVNILKRNKVKLVRWLSTDFQFMLQHSHSGDIIDDRVYQRLRNKSPPEDACIDLIDSLMSRGEGPSSDFLKLLKDPEIHSTYNTQLKDWILSLELPGEIFVLYGLAVFGGGKPIWEGVIYIYIWGNNG